MSLVVKNKSKFKSRIIYTNRIDYIPKRKEYRDAIDSRLIDWIITMGSTPIGVPNLLESKCLLSDWLNYIKPQGIILSGGNNVGEFKFRDLTEYKLLKYATLKSIPVLGICRGMQIMSSYYGSKLEAVSGHSGTSHKLITLNKNINYPKKVNSFHDYRIKLCPSEFNITAISDDETIEAIKHKKYPFEGWMWHPERDKEFSDILLNLARNLFSINQ